MCNPINGYRYVCGKLAALSVYGAERVVDLSVYAIGAVGAAGADYLGRRYQQMQLPRASPPLLEQALETTQALMIKFTFPPEMCVSVFNSVVEGQKALPSPGMISTIFSTIYNNPIKSTIALVPSGWGILNWIEDPNAVLPADNVTRGPVHTGAHNALEIYKSGAESTADHVLFPVLKAVFDTTASLSYRILVKFGHHSGEQLYETAKKEFFPDRTDAPGEERFGLVEIGLQQGQEAWESFNNAVAPQIEAVRESLPDAKTARIGAAVVATGAVAFLAYRKRQAISSLFHRAMKNLSAFKEASVSKLRGPNQPKGVVEIRKPLK